MLPNAFHHCNRFINTFCIYSTITHWLNWILLTQIFNSTMYADYMQNDSIKTNIMQISVSYPFQWTIWHQSSPIKDVLVIISDFSKVESTGRHREEAISECLNASKADWHSIYKAPALVSTWLPLLREVFHLWLPSLFCFVRFQYQNTQLGVQTGNYSMCYCWSVGVCVCGYKPQFSVHEEKSLVLYLKHGLKLIPRRIVFYVCIYLHKII